MSYDLAFWADPHPGERDPQAVFQMLLDGQEVEGLTDFYLDATVAALARAFPGIDADPSAGYTVWERPGGGAVVEFFWSRQHLFAMARGDVGNDEMNSIINICIEVGGARLYDPQTGERFDGI